MADARPTKKQREVLNFVSTYLDTHGYSPSYREIGSMVGIKSVSTVSRHIDNLVTKGFLQKETYGPRSVTVVGKSSEFTPIGQAEQSFERSFVEQVEARIRLLDQDGQPDGEEIKEVELLIDAMKALGMHAAVPGLRRQLDAALPMSERDDDSAGIDLDAAGISKDKAGPEAELEITSV